MSDVNDSMYWGNSPRILKVMGWWPWRSALPLLVASLLRAAEMVRELGQDVAPISETGVLLRLVISGVLPEVHTYAPNTSLCPCWWRFHDVGEPRL